MLHGVTFNEQLVTSADMAHAHYVFSGRKSGVTKGCEVTYSGLNLYVAPGAMLTCGRLTVVTSTEEVSVTAVTAGTQYCRLVYEVDLSLINTEEDFNQGAIKVLQSASGYPEITQENLDNGGDVYDLPLARFVVSSSGISDFVDERVTFDTTTHVTLPASGWSNVAPYTQTVNVDNVTVNDNPPQGIEYPDGCTDSERKAIQKAAALIIKMVTGDGTITFTATAKPDTSITLGLLL